jgi:hypothetical protein
MVRVANMNYFDRGIFTSARKEMLYDYKIYLILYKRIEMNTYLFMTKPTHDIGIVSTGNC